MTRTHLVALLAGLIGLCACGGGATPESARNDAAAATSEVAPEILPRPYTAEQIRQEWVPGLRLLMRRTTPEGRMLERWTVLTADEQGAEIEFSAVDEQGSPLAPPRVERQTWIELRDHASFPAQTTRREEVSLQTPLGTFDGWVYTQRDEQSGTQRSLFFARDLPGAPLLYRVTQADRVLLELAQIERHRPE